MKILENKKGTKSTLFITIALFGVGFALYSYYGYGASAVFTMAVSVLCAIFCVKKIFQESFLEIDDEGFFVKKGAKEAKFYFKDIENIDTRTIDVKKNAQILSVYFKKNRFDPEFAEGLIQPIGKDEAVILDNYEQSIHELRVILREKLRNFKDNQK